MDVKQIQLILQEMLKDDFQKRDELIERGSLFIGYHPEMEQIHVINSKKLEQIINEFGFPTKSKVGKESATAAWTIVMHSISNPPFMKKILALLKSPQYKDQVDLKELAYFEDRIRVFERKPQIYGTQFDWDENDLLSPYPIENFKRVNQLREKIGLLPIEEQTEIMRERARIEGNQPAKNYLERVKEIEEWAKKVRWIT
ncbi:DUF6624 domain-containing protein [Paenibacillus sp. 1P07SE]|uniref:DUF6624 domain-containing protein n=1 Tax=Paenibacillus sp. 1P07SE TaxID=3132209 RepID=UPI0039A71E53